MTKLGVNIDHVATIREARKIEYPDPIRAAEIVEEAGADSIVVHLRKDRRHIKDKDVETLRKTIKTRLNLEMSINPEIIQIAKQIKPNQVTLVPERRQELTTEGGLDVTSNAEKIKKVIDDFKRSGIIVSLFVDPDINQIEASESIGADAVELHTGEYSNAKDEISKNKYLQQIEKIASFACGKGLNVFAGHGLNYENTKDIADVPEIEELNIGHSIISEAIFIGLNKAVKKMIEIIQN
jgi:pyridoxine 5-phosphate synthase